AVHKAGWLRLGDGEGPGQYGREQVEAVAIGQRLLREWVAEIVRPADGHEHAGDAALARPLDAIVVPINVNESRDSLRLQLGEIEGAACRERIQKDVGEDVITNDHRVRPHDVCVLLQAIREAGWLYFRDAVDTRRDRGKDVETVGVGELSKTVGNIGGGQR